MLEHIPVGFMGKVDEKLSRKRKNVLFAQKGQKAKGFWRFEHILLVLLSEISTSHTCTPSVVFSCYS
jgi:hypothetical protein